MGRWTHGTPHGVTVLSLSMSFPLRRAPLTVTALLVASSMWTPAVSAQSAHTAPTPAPAVHSTHPGLLGGDDDGWKADKDLGSLYKVTRSAGVQHVWNEDDPSKRKVTGKGVGVALIDSGVTEVKGLDGQGDLRPGPVLRVPGPRHRATSTPSGTAPTWPGSSPDATPA